VAQYCGENKVTNKIERREFIRKAALGTAAVGGTAMLGACSGAQSKKSADIAAPAISKSKKQWTAVSAFGKAGLLGRALDRFATFVGNASDGQLVIKPYHAGELVKGLEAMDAVQSGTAQMGFGAPYYWAGKSDSISFVAAMPFGLTGQEQNAWAYYGGGIELADKHAYNPLGLKFLPLGNTGNQMGGWYNKEINSEADLKGLKSGWHEPGTILDAFFDKKEWDSLTPELRAIVEYAAATTNMQVLSEFQAMNNVAIGKLVDEGVQIKKYDDSLVNAVAKRAEKVIPNLGAKSADSKILFNHVIDFRNGMVQWGSYSEAAFMNARTAAKFKKV